MKPRWWCSSNRRWGRNLDHPNPDLRELDRNELANAKSERTRSKLGRAKFKSERIELKSGRAEIGTSQIVIKWLGSRPRSSLSQLVRLRLHISEWIKSGKIILGSIGTSKTIWVNNYDRARSSLARLVQVRPSLSELDQARSSLARLELLHLPQITMEKKILFAKFAIKSSRKCDQNLCLEKLNQITIPTLFNHNLGIWK